MQFALLGRVQLLQGDREVPVGGPKPRALLAILLLNANEVVSRDRLIDGLWGETPPPSVAHTLDDNVSRLRRAVGPDRIERRAPGYLISVEPGELDLDRFEQLFREGREALAAGDPAQAAAALGRALALWRGQALADLLFEPFAQDEGRRLDERRLLAREEWHDAQLALGQGAELIPELERLVAAHPLRERLVAQLMLALYRAARQREALTAYATVRQRLADEFGLAPGPLLEAQQRAILNHDPTLRLPPMQASEAQVWRERRPGRLRRPLVSAVAISAIVGVAVAVALGVGGKPSSARAIMDNALVGLSTRSGERLNAVPLFGAPAAIAAEGAGLWLADPDKGAITHVDLVSRTVVDRIPLGGNPGVMAIGGGSLWVAGLPGTSVTRIDLATAAVTERVPLAGASTSALAFGAGGLWIADATDNSLIELDPVSAVTRRTVALPLRPTALAIGAGAVWAADYDANAIAQIDPRSGRVLATISVPNGPVALVAGAGALWVASTLDSTVSKIDPARGSIVSTIPVGSGPVALAYAAGSVWVASQYSGTVSRVDPSRNVVADVLPAGGVPTALTAVGHRLWVTVRTRVQHRGGTLVMLHQGPVSIDPGVESGVSPFQSLGLTSDGLVTFNHVGGPKGLELVPDLAIRLPTPTDAGTTYTFRLRAGIRYSDGRLVQPADFRRGIERVLRLRSLDRDLLSGIVGAAACGNPNASRCDLKRGILTDPAARTVTFHLIGPDPQFLVKLTNGGVSIPVPPGTPMHPTGFTPIPGTGPYMVASVDRHHIRYVRNPRFREWSHAAQPAGNPDAIVWRFGLTASQEVREIEQGRADWMGDPVPGSLLRQLQTRYASRVQTYPTTDTEWLQFNTTRPPFDDVRVRRALNFAVDRGAIVRIWGGAALARPTCQLLPPGVPGFRGYCPYTHHPKRDGTWTAPDVERARRLVAASGTQGMPVTVWGWTDDPYAPRSVVNQVAGVLRSLGYRVATRFVPHAALADPPARTFAAIQVIPTGWSDTTAYGFVAPWLTCVGAGDHGWFCHSPFDRKVLEARSLEATRPRAAARLWEEIDRDIVDRAALVPLVNPRLVDFHSQRVGNSQHHAYLSLIADQVWLH
jgi:peptide/nickel transport system substrate-binding protein